MNVLIVESPSKAKSINKYLGSEFKVLASVGHVRDLSAKNDASKLTIRHESGKMCFPRKTAAQTTSQQSGANPQKIFHFHT